MYKQVETEINGKIISVRPENYKSKNLSIFSRIYYALQVIVGKAETFVWPEMIILECNKCQVNVDNKMQRNKHKNIFKKITFCSYRYEYPCKDFKPTEKKEKGKVTNETNN